MFSELEAHNLSLITTGQETEEMLQDLEDRVTEEVRSRSVAMMSLIPLVVVHDGAVVVGVDDDDDDDVDDDDDGGDHDDDDDDDDDVDVDDIDDD